MKIGVIYWSGTGNTEMMAAAVAEGARAAGADVDVMTVSETDAAGALAYDALALGCPAMGAEELEETEFEPFFAELESSLPYAGAPFRFRRSASILAEHPVN